MIKLSLLNEVGDWLLLPDLPISSLIILHEILDLFLDEDIILLQNSNLAFLMTLLNILQ